MEIFGLKIERAKKKAACQYVDLLGRSCESPAASSCATCDLLLCESDMHIDPAGSARDRHDFHYCQDCVVNLNL